MPAATLRNIVGFSVVITHFVAIFAVLLLFFDLQMMRRVEIALVVSPIFFVFSMSILRSYVSQRAVLADDEQLNRSFAILAILITWFFLLFMLSGLVLFAMQRILSPEELKTYLSISETSFGAFLGLLVDTLFGGAKHERS